MDFVIDNWVWLKGQKRICPHSTSLLFYLLNSKYPPLNHIHYDEEGTILKEYQKIINSMYWKRLYRNAVQKGVFKKKNKKSINLINIKDEKRKYVQVSLSDPITPVVSEDPVYTQIQCLSSCCDLEVIAPSDALTSLD